MQRVSSFIIITITITTTITTPNPLRNSCSIDLASYADPDSEHSITCANSRANIVLLFCLFLFLVPHFYKRPRTSFIRIRPKGIVA